MVETLVFASEPVSSAESVCVCVVCVCVCVWVGVCVFARALGLRLRAGGLAVSSTRIIYVVVLFQSCQGLLLWLFIELWLATATDLSMYVYV